MSNTNGRGFASGAAGAFAGATLQATPVRPRRRPPEAQTGLIDDEFLVAPGTHVTEVPTIEIQGDVPPELSPRLGHFASALPEFLSEPFVDMVRDRNSTAGRAVRGVADFADDVGIPDGLDPVNVERMQTFGERGADALPLGFGEEIYSELVDPFGQRRRERIIRGPNGYTPEEQADIDAGRAVEADPDLTTTTRRGIGHSNRIESDRDQYLRERSQRSAAHPYASAAGTIVGSLPAAIAVPAPAAPAAQALATATRAQRVLGAGGRVVNSALRNAGVGGVQAIGTSDVRLSDEGGAQALAAEGLLGAGYGGAGGGLGQLGGEVIGGARNIVRGLRSPVQTQTARAIAASSDLADGQRAGDLTRRFLADENEQVIDDLAELVDDPDVLVPAPRRTPPPRDLPDRPRVETEDYMQGLDPEPRVGLIDDLDGLPTLDGDAPGRPYVPPRLDAADEFDALAEAPRPRRAAPRHPHQGPALREAAERGQAMGTGGADDLSVEMTDRMNRLARDYADIETSTGGFQDLKNREIGRALAEVPPPRGWEERARQMIAATRQQLDAITRHAGAADQLHRPVGQARMALDQADSLLNAGVEFGRPTSPAEVYRELNRANMGIGQAASREASAFGDGMQHTSAYARPLRNAYEDMRGFLADPQAWGQRAADVQASMNEAITPLLRDASVLRDRVGRMFTTSGDAVAGDTFRSYQAARPEPLRQIFGRAADAAYEAERDALRSWVENYAEQSNTLARLSGDAGLTARAQAMQTRASELLDLIDQADVDGRAASLLREISRNPSHRIPGLPAPSIGQLVSMLRRIETGDLPAQGLGVLGRYIDGLAGALEAGVRRTGPAARTEAVREVDELNAARGDTAPVERVEEEDEIPEWMRQREEARRAGQPVAPDSLSTEESDTEGEDEIPEWMRQREEARRGR